VEDGKRLGAMMWGRPEARLLESDADHVLELTRMVFETSKEFLSRSLSNARHYIRKWFPQIRLLLTYADPEQGHDGAVYKADGWASFGKTTNKPGGWKNREGRHDACGHPKIRFLRTP